MDRHSAVPSRALIAGLFLMGGLAACSDSTDCSPTDGAIIVQVRDSVSGLPAAGAAVGRIRSPSFYGTLGQTTDDLTLTGAAPPGRYEVTVIAPGYQTWSESRVDVESASGCGAETTTIEALLQPL